MKYIIRLTESELYRMVGDIASRLLRENMHQNGVLRFLKDLGLESLVTGNGLQEAKNSVSKSMANRVMKGTENQQSAVKNQNDIKNRIENETGDIITRARNIVSHYNSGEKNYNMLRIAKELYPRLSNFDDSEAKALSNQLSSIVKVLSSDESIRPTNTGNSGEDDFEYDPNSIDYTPTIDINKDMDNQRYPKSTWQKTVAGSEGDDIEFVYDPTKVRAGLRTYDFSPHSIDNVVRHGQEYHDKGKGISLDNDSTESNRNLVARVSNIASADDDFARSEEFGTILRTFIPIFLDGQKSTVDTGEVVKTIKFDSEESVMRASNILFDYYNFANYDDSDKKITEQDKLNALSQKYGLSTKWIGMIIIAALNVLRNSYEFKNAISRALAGKYDVVNGKVINTDTKPTKQKEDTDASIDAQVKNDYLTLFKKTYRMLFNANCPKIQLPKDSNYSLNEFKLIFIGELVDDYDKLPDDEKKLMLKRLEKTYNRLFYNKWENYLSHK